MTVRFVGVHYHYGGLHVLDGIDFTVSAGEVVSLVGPNGSGKSTLLKCANAILTPTSGHVLLDHKLTTDYSRRDLARAVTYVPQQQGTAMPLSVFDMVAIGRAPYRGFGTSATDHDRVLDAIEQLGLESLARRSFGALSGGERQRVLMARALAQDGRLLLLDEPTSALDLRHQLDTMSLVRSVAESRDIAVLIAIHDLALAGRFSDRLVMLREGRVRTEGCWQDVLTSEHVEAVYGVSTHVGTDSGLPYVIPIHSAQTQAPSEAAPQTAEKSSASPAALGAASLGPARRGRHH